MPKLSRPSWIPAYLPELDGLRGLAVLAVFFYHCRPRITAGWTSSLAAWGWSGVNLFFVLSGFLITSILLEAREQPRHYFRNFYARRALRIWPVYLLVMAVCFAGPDWLLLLPGNVRRWQSAAAMLLMIQNLFSAQLTGTGALGPTWSLAIEEQYYLVWAAVVRYIRSVRQLGAVLVMMIVASPLLRLYFGAHLNVTHTLLHLDGIAFGSLLALALADLPWTRRTWFLAGLSSVFAGLLLTVLFHATAFLDSALALCFAGSVLTAIASTGTRNPIAWALRCAPLRFYGRISYSLYLVHVGLFIYFGFIDMHFDRLWGAGSWRANICVIAVRLLISTAVATALWYGLERRVLRFKRYFAVGS